MTENPNSQKPNNSKRIKYIVIITLVFLALGAIYWVYWNTTGKYNIYTDNAYVSGDIVQITPLTSGAITDIFVDDTDFVEAGTVLAKLDNADAIISLQKAEAQLALTVRQVNTLYASNSKLEAVVNQRQTALQKAKNDLSRRAALKGTGAIPQEDIDHAYEAVEMAKQALQEAKENLKASQSLTVNSDIKNHPDVKKASTQLKESFLELKRTEIFAPVDGFIAKRSAQKGEWVNKGKTLMAVVPLNQVWVDANFKENQLRNMRIGQEVVLYSDIFGKSVKYNGIIQGFSAGTGSVFSLLPPQNATGNWIKVVQRLAVRIELNSEEIKENPLQLGMSMKANVDIRNTDGKRFSTSIKDKKQESFNNNLWEDDAAMLIETIINTNILP